jgi:antitoxin component of MazEF toxin-antitoxin module
MRTNSFVWDSGGVHIPAALLEQVGIKDEVELVAGTGCLIIQPGRTTRRRWEEAVASLLECADDAAPLGEIPDFASM